MKTMFCIPRTLGDVVLATTIVRELKKEEQELEIHFYVNRPYDGLLANNPDVAEVHASGGWDFNMLFLEMASGKYGRIYAPYQARPECNMWHQFSSTRDQHLVDFYWKRMGMHRPITERECYLHPSEGDFRRAESFISFDQPRIALHGTTNVRTKDWPYFDALVEELRKSGYGCVQVGAQTDRRMEGAIDLRGKMSLLEIAAFLSKCAAFVGLDSGISYMADAMKTPTVVIQGSTSPVTSGPISSRVTHLFAETTGYADCEKVRCHVECRHEVNCITKINIPMVMEKLEPALAAWHPPIPAGVES